MKSQQVGIAAITVPASLPHFAVGHAPLCSQWLELFVVVGPNWTFGLLIIHFQLSTWSRAAADSLHLTTWVTKHTTVSPRFGGGVIKQLAPARLRESYVLCTTLYRYNPVKSSLSIINSIYRWKHKWIHKRKDAFLFDCTTFVNAANRGCC